ncbi:single-stranded-DNA-specific exonuclease [Erythromicrobium ramosum]|uniref:Single-stranded-DNA-specific exonuclease RecJ n=1 Tax=Erythrobacter ramosus TaxID=35811 RepID=A0A6I4UJI7_9SPHN|nr:single-stranded-DNA-specific exonuclease RecJ [Erythrobacter ramosus]MBB3776168.1 single-stranded-DNA-specific exonuclease [Erythrobacter ramosus]MXP38748.1 single-stranded-DNA-specific exonuclease RecJ [Erythrobacter ramosus]
MASHTLSPPPFAPVLGVAVSLSGKAWRWRGGNMELDAAQAGGPHGLNHAVLDQLLLTRGVAEDDLARHAQPTIRAFLPDPSTFRDMDTAAERLAHSVMTGERVTIYGDYDVDGATSAALLVELLRQLGLNAGYYIPDRLLEGYGPSGEALVKLGETGSSLIVTVDCGAMAHEALGMARDAGVDVIVVDHHKCSPDLPPATALVNPNRLDESDLGAAHGHLAAVGVAFLLGVALVRTLRGRGWFGEHRREPDLMGLLDLVALGTVADVAALHGLNRAFVAQGLKVLARRERIGMAALMDASRLTRAPQASDLGFALGPRINAGGRIGESTLGVRLLTTTDPEEARAIAAQLSQLNEERRAIEGEVQEAAEALIAGQHNMAVQVIAGHGWHPGVIGIVAGRIKEKTGKPAVVIALDETQGKGSGRSISGVDLGAAIIAAREAGLLVAGGGHAMAAGLTIDPARLSDFAGFLDERLARDVDRARAGAAMLLDLALAPGGLTPELVETLEAAGPYGVGWPAPRIAVGPVRIVKADIVGKDHLRLIASGNDGKSFKAIAFRAGESEMGQTLLHRHQGRRFYLAGRVKLDDWGNRPAAELHLEDAAFAD